MKVNAISGAFAWRRIHSLLGLWIVLYLMEHLIVNSQAALWIGESGSGFIYLVNSIQALPYLQVIETVLIGVPIGVHAIWGIHRAWTARTNSRRTDGTLPSLEYERNQAFTWQRITSWILLLGIIGHVAQMRFLERPKDAQVGEKKFYFTALSFDSGLYTLSARLGVEMYTKSEIQTLLDEPIERENTSVSEEKRLQEEQYTQERGKFLKTLSSYSLGKDQIVAVSPTPGTAMLLMVRNAFKSPLLATLYTLFLLAATFHAFNGFWTFLITWGLILSYPSQKGMLKCSYALFFGFLVLGLFAIWGSYWLNLRT